VAGKREIHPDEVEGLYRNLVELSPMQSLSMSMAYNVFVKSRCGQAVRGLLAR